MTKFGIYKETTNIPFENHLVELDGIIRDRLLELRKFVNSMGDNVIEEVRPHRISYSKTVVFRVFLDLQPTKNELTISIRKDRKNPSKIYKLTCNNHDLIEIKNDIQDAYKNIT
ncbi:MAG: hypothetical protein ACE5SW_10715 [Nitrososphaeraceae archaeon]